MSSERRSDRAAISPSGSGGLLLLAQSATRGPSSPLHGREQSRRSSPSLPLPGERSSAGGATASGRRGWSVIVHHPGLGRSSVGCPHAARWHHPNADCSRSLPRQAPLGRLARAATLPGLLRLAFHPTACLVRRVVTKTRLVLDGSDAEPEYCPSVVVRMTTAVVVTVLVTFMFAAASTRTWGHAAHCATLPTADTVGSDVRLRLVASLPVNVSDARRRATW